MPRLPLTPEEFRRLVERAARFSSDFLATLPDRPSFPKVTGDETEKLYAGVLPEEGSGERVFDDIAQVFELGRPPGPRFFGYVLGSGEPVAAIGDLLASVLNQNLTAWRSSPSAVSMERGVVATLAHAIGCDGFTGSLTGGGSSANLMGLALAREAHAPANVHGAQGGVVYASDEIHMSMPKALALLGLGRENLRLIPADENFRLSPARLEQAITADRAAGKKPIAVVASAGTVNTGAIDPLRDIAAVARRQNIWFHVDGAYGALAAMAAPEKFAGLADADSLSLDAHKWLYQPVDCGCLLFKDAAHARATFAYSGDYTKTFSADPVEGFAFFEESMELSRRFRALKLWLSLRYHGVGAFRASIAEDLRLAQLLADRIRGERELELLAPVELSIVCFRHRGFGAASPDDLNRFNAAVLKRMHARRRVYVSNATLRGAFALRPCLTNHRATEADVLAIADEAVAAAREIAQTPATVAR